MKIYTHNLGIDNGDPERRLHDFSERIEASRPDIMFIQEVSSVLGYTALNALTRRLGTDYSMHYETTYPSQEDDQGLAIITNLTVRKSFKTSYSDKGNQSQVLELQGDHGMIIATNIHHEASPMLELQRYRKNTELSNLLNSRYAGFPHVIAGDFNALPQFPSIRTLQRSHGFLSLYKAFHGHHDHTYPTMSISDLLSGKFMKAQEIDTLRKLTPLTNFMRFNNYELPAYTIDYVLARNIGKVVNAKLIRSWRDVSEDALQRSIQQRDSHHAFAISDHYGIETEVTL